MVKQAGFKAVFTSGNNLKEILTRKNKSNLPPNSHSGLYKLDCCCKKSYIGETGCKISTRVKQHQMVYGVLQDELATETIHALSLKTFTPEAWQATGQTV